MAKEQKTKIPKPEQIAAIMLSPKIQETITIGNGRCDNLTPQEKAEYINWLCQQAGVDPSLRPFDFIPTKNGLMPYLNKGGTEIIRDGRGISIIELKVNEVNNLYVVNCTMRDRSGRTDTDIGACPKGSEPHNDLMKAVTKAKRRCTLSLCRLGGIIEEAHPSEYANSTNNSCKSAVLLEDVVKNKKEAEAAELMAKNKFAEACKRKTSATLSKENLTQLLPQARKAVGKEDITICAEWVENHKLDILVIADEKDPKITTAAFKEK